MEAFFGRRIFNRENLGCCVKSTNKVTEHQQSENLQPDVPKAQHLRYSGRRIKIGQEKGHFFKKSPGIWLLMKNRD
jgi:hypothetical protein